MKYILTFLLIFFCFHSGNARGEYTKDKLKTLFIYNFTKYINWPDGAITTEFVIGILGKNKGVEKQLNRMAESKTVMKLPIKIVHFNKIEDVTGVHMLYFSKYNGNYNVKEVFQRVDNDPVLVVTEGYGFGKSMINFVTINKRQKFELNLEKCNRAGLNVSSSLLDLAIVTKEEWDSILSKLGELVNTNKKTVKIETSELASLLSDHKSLMADIENSRKELADLSEQALAKESDLDAQEKELVLKQEQVAEVEKKIAELGIEVEAHVVQIESQGKEIESQQSTIYMVGSFLLITLVLGILAVRSSVLKNKANKIILLQKETEEKQRIEIELQKEQAEQKNKEVLDSITYAERIQAAILPPLKYVSKLLPESFIYFKPKDIVAGDFYWLETVEDDIYFSAADCTGHGVPGAMMSVMCSNALTQCVKEMGLSKPGDILNATTKTIEGRFERSEQLVLDGMDLALCKLNLKTKQLEYAGANNPLWIVRKEELLETKADKQPIGQYDHRQPYTNHQIQLQKGDSIYIFSDGYVDQFGGPKGKKFKSKPFKELLLSIRTQPMDRQKELIEGAFENWKGIIEQIDDVCVIGVRI